jgi:hypothetical protein
LIKEGDITLINSIISRYGKVTDEEKRLTLMSQNKTIREIIAASPADDKIIERMRL